MIRLLDYVFPRAAVAVSVARAADAAAFAELHAASFRRGWTEDEFEQLLADRSVLAHRAMRGRRLCGFVLSRRAADEAEILSVAVDRRDRGAGIAGRLVDLHMRQLAAMGVRALYLEVDENNAAARRLYARAGFVEAGRRPAYYPQHPQAAGAASGALILRRSLI